MRARNIKPGFYKNEDLVECSMAARLLAPGLWMMADREGRLEYRPKRIKMEVFPADNLDVEPLLDELEQAGHIQRYDVAGKRYIQVLKFTDHQTPHSREKDSVIPACIDESLMPASENTRYEAQYSDAGRKEECASTDLGNAEARPRQCLAPPDSLNPDSLNPDCGLGKGGVGENHAVSPCSPPDGDEPTQPSVDKNLEVDLPDVAEAEPCSDQHSPSPPQSVPKSRRHRSKAPPKTLLSADFVPPDSWLEYARMQGLTEQEAGQEWGKFRDHHIAKANKFADWDATWRIWIRRSVEYQQQRRSLA